MKATKPTLPDRIARLAKIAGSQNKLADLVGVSGPTTTGWMGGSEPYQRTLAQIYMQRGAIEELARAHGARSDAIHRRRRAQ